MIQYLASQALLLFSGGDYHVTPTPDVVFTGHRMLEEEPKADIPLENRVHSDHPYHHHFLEHHRHRKGGQSYAWNIFRYSGDLMHLCGLFGFVFTVAVKNKHVQGFSKKTQIIFFIIYVSRYLDLLSAWNHQSTYLIGLKLTFIILSTISVALFYFFRSTYEKPKDTCSLFLILIVALILMILLTKKTKSDELKVVLVEYMWTLSEILEAVCLVPQYVFRYRDNANTDKGVFLFIFCLGGYRVLYMFNWIYRKIENPQYSDIRSWLAGIVEILFFIDFLMYRLKGFSILRSFVLGVDDRIGWVSDSVEFRILGKTDDDEHAAGDSELRQRKKPTNNELEEFDPTEV